MWLIAISHFFFFQSRFNSFVRSLRFKHKRAAAHLNQCTLFESMITSHCVLSQWYRYKKIRLFPSGQTYSSDTLYCFVSFILISLHHFCFLHQMFKVRCCDLGTLCSQTQMGLTDCSLYRLWTLGGSKIQLIDKTWTFPSAAQRSGVVPEGRIFEAQRRFDSWSRCLRNC